MPDPFSERAGTILESPRGDEKGGGEKRAAATATAAAAKAAAEAAANDPSSSYDDGVLDAPVATPATLAAADVILLGAPARQGGMCGEMRLFLDSLAPAAEAASANPNPSTKAQKNKNSSGNQGPPSRTATPPPPLSVEPVSLRGKVGAAFTAIGGPARGHGGAETVLSSFHATFLSHGMVVVGAPPSPMMDGAPGSTPLGAVASGGGEEERKALAAGRQGGSSNSSAAALAAAGVSLSGTEVRLGYSLGQWAAQVGALLHGDDDGGGGGGGGGGGACE